MTPPQTSAEGDLIRHVVRSLVGHVAETPRDVTRHLLGMARDFDARRCDTPRPALAGRWVRRTKGNAGPGTTGLGHVAAATSVGLDHAFGVCGKQLRGDLDWAHPATPDNRADGWRPCRVCVAAVASTTPLTTAARPATTTAPTRLRRAA